MTDQDPDMKKVRFLQIRIILQKCALHWQEVIPVEKQMDIMDHRHIADRKYI